MKNGKVFTHKKRAFRKRLKKSKHKKRTLRGSYGIPWGKNEVSRLLPLDALHPEDYGDAAGGVAEQSA